MSSFNGKSVLVLGGSRGVGAVIMRRSATDDASVIFTYSGSPDAAKTLADETGTQTAQTDSAGRNAVIDRVRESGPLDMLVINAGTILFGGVLEQDPDDVEHPFRTNVHSPYYAAAEAARQMPDGGRIITIGSVDGDCMPLIGLAFYAVSKSVLQGLARGLVRNFGPRSITVNVVQSGPIDTDADLEDGLLKEVVHSFMALKRHGRSGEVAGMVAWSAGPKAGFMTGVMCTIDDAFGA